MPLYAKGPFRCLYVHIPKAGGTSLKLSLRRFGWEEQLSIRGKRVQDLKHLTSSPQHFHRDLLEPLLRWEAIDFAFTVCRHPFHRMKSEYYWQQSHGLAPAREPARWLEAVLARHEQDPYAFDNHLRPQVDFVLPHPGFQVLKLEEGGMLRALEHMESLAPATPLQRLYNRLRPPRTHRATRVADVEQAFEVLRPRIEAYYARDMAHFGYA
ncbi:MAG: hypothetical protein RI988_3190 [Pseudomonadota bacterium]|jgi:hypothetical protein